MVGRTLWLRRYGAEVPPTVILLVGSRGHRYADVALGLPRVSPENVELGAWLAVLHVDEGQCQRFAKVVTVSGIGRVPDYGAICMHGVHPVGHVKGVRYAFLELGPGAHSWLVEAAAAGAQRVRSKMTAAVELAALVGTGPVMRRWGSPRPRDGSPRVTCSPSWSTAPAEHRPPRSWSPIRPTPPNPAPPPGHRSAPPARRSHDDHDVEQPRRAGAAPELPEELLAVLKRMRLPYLRNAAPEVLATARAQRWDPAEVLRVLISEEIKGRDEATKRMHRKAAGLPAGKIFGSWRQADSSIPPGTQTGLATLEWVRRAENVAIAGPCVIRSLISKLACSCRSIRCCD